MDIADTLTLMISFGVFDCIDDVREQKITPHVTTPCAKGLLDLCAFPSCWGWSIGTVPCYSMEWFLLCYAYPRLLYHIGSRCKHFSNICSSGQTIPAYFNATQEGCLLHTLIFR
ncbi:hypothetical protein X953_07190 [Virgibacillus sp. SK37]|nr:hypothetical protein X953_07190 [Virgibacillus sp. SK37]